MASQKISELAVKATPISTDVLPIVDSATGTNKKITLDSLPVSTATQNALNTKQNSIGYTPENTANKENTTLDTSSAKFPTNNLVKTYVDTGLSGKQDSLGYTAENAANKDTDTTLAANSDTNYPSQKAVKTYIDLDLSGKGKVVDYQVFNTSGTWVKPTDASASAMVEIVLMSGSGGGGSGRRGAAGTVRTGGGSGAGGAGIRVLMRVSDLPSSASIVIGSKGLGGSSVLTDDTNGNAGTAGGSTIFGNLLQTGTSGGGGGGQLGASASAGTASNGNTGFFILGTTSGAVSSASGSTGGAGGNPNTIVPCGAGSGGGITVGDAGSNGGVGGRYTSTSIVANGPSAGTAGLASAVIDGGQGQLVSGITLFGMPLYTGPGGGAARTSSAAGRGADGLGNCGGAGGGASANGFASGKGGDGCNGWAVIIVYS